MRFIKFSLSLAKKTHLLVLGTSLLCLLYMGLFANAVSSIFFTTFLFVVGIGILSLVNSKDRGDLHSTLRLFTFVFSCSIIITCLIFVYYMQVFGVPYESGGTDDARFEYQAYVLKASKVKTYDAAKDIIRLEGTGTWNVAGN